MIKKDKQYTIYIRSTKESIPVNKEEFDAYYHDINIYRIRQQRHGRCVCPASKRLTCDMDCLTCPFHRMGDTRSLDYTETDDEGNETAWVDEIPDDSPLLEDIIIEASEMKALYSKYVESGFGTGDCVLIADGTLNIVDYKHGKGVEVSADHNPQMMLYALGALELFDALYDIDTVTMTIYQPRRSNVSTYTVSTAELLEWAETVLKPTAELAFKGEGEFHCGEWCRFCKAKADCRERARANLALAAYDFAEPPLLTDEEVEEVLSKVDDLVSWANDIKEYALQAAISGKAWNGWKVVEGRSNRKYTDERLVAAAVIAAGHDPYEQKLLGITEMQKTLGKAKFDEILGRFITKPQGKPTLVPMSDKRPAMNTAASDFEN